MSVILDLDSHDNYFITSFNIDTYSFKKKNTWNIYQALTKDI